MSYKFKAYGHENITARHKTPLEFTKDKNLSLNGDCIVGVNADFELASLKKFIDSSLKKNNRKIRIIVKANFNKDNPIIKKSLKKINYKKIIKEEINAELNPYFSSNEEFVIRKTDFISERTFAIKANKAAFGLNRDLTEFLKERNNSVEVIIKNR